MRQFVAGILIGISLGALAPRDVDWSVLPTPITVVKPPFEADSPTLLIVEEIDERGKLPASQRDIFTSLKLRQYLDNHGWEYRFWDQGVDASRDKSELQEALDVDRESVPWIVGVRDKRGVNQPLPNTVDEVIALLEGLQ